MQLCKADDEQADRLEVEPGSLVSVITRIKARDGEPFAEMVSIVPELIIPFFAFTAPKYSGTCRADRVEVEPRPRSNPEDRSVDPILAGQHGLHHPDGFDHRG